MISIIIPAYNSRATIVEALESVASQTLWSQWAVGSEPCVAKAMQGRQLAVKKSEAQVAADVTTLRSSVPSLRSRVPAAEIESAEKEKSFAVRLRSRQAGTSLRQGYVGQAPNATLSCPSYASRFTSHVSPPTFEVIVVDDCFTDDTVAVVERWIAGRGELLGCQVVQLLSESPASPGELLSCSVDELLSESPTDSLFIFHPFPMISLSRPAVD